MHPVKIPHEQVNDESVMLVEWLAGDGARVEVGQPVATIETSKSTAQIESPCAGFLRHGAAKGAELPVGSIFCYVASNPTDPLPSVPLRTQASLPTSAPQADVMDRDAEPERGAATPSGETRFSKPALALIERHRLSKEQFSGRTLIREGDVMAVLGGGQATAAPATKAPPEERSGPIPAAGVAVEAVELSRAKRVEGKYLASGFAHTLASVVNILCPTSGLVAAVKRHAELGGNTSAIIVFEAARLLRKIQCSRLP